MFTSHRAADRLSSSTWSHEYATATGERATVTLRDGSRITLAPHSWLGVASGFGAGQRIVSLRGEALFDVVGASQTPFLVRTGSVTTQVLGTTFDVRHYEGDRAVRVAVHSGRVRIATVASAAGHARAATVAAGMMALATDSSVEATLDDNAAQFGAWANGQLVFRDALLSDVLATLTRWYGYRFRLADSTLAHDNLTMRVRVDSPNDAIATLTKLLGVTLTMRDSTIWLSRQQGALARPKARDLRDLVAPTAEVGR